MNEFDLSLLKAVTVGHQLIEVIVGIIDRERRRAGKIAVRPCIREYVHRDARRLQGFPLRQLDGFDDQIAVRLADQAVFIQIPFSAALPCRVKIIRKKMERRPDAGDILQPDAVCPHVHHFQLQLCRCGGTRRFQR